MALSRFLLAAACCALALAAQAAPPSRLRGTILAVTTDGLELRPDGGGETMAITLAPTLRVTLAEPARLSDIRPGDFIGTAAQNRSDGTTVAEEVHIFPDSMRGTGEGHRPFDRGPASSMTNGTVGQEVVGSTGQTLTVRYKGGATEIVVPPDTPVVMLAPGDRTALVPGAHATVFTPPASDGPPAAANILVGRNGFVPPM